MNKLSSNKAAPTLLAAIVIDLALLAAGGVSSAGTLLGPTHQTIVSCQMVCVRKASAPRPGEHGPKGIQFRQCTNNLTGQIVSWSPVVPTVPCG